MSSRLLGSRSRDTSNGYGIVYRSRNTRRDTRHSLFDVRAPALSILSRAEGLTDIYAKTKQQQLRTLGKVGSAGGTPVDKVGQETVFSKKPRTTPTILTGGLRVINTGTRSDLEISGAAVQNIHDFRSGLDITDSFVQNVHDLRSGLDVIDRSVQAIHSFEPGAAVTDCSVQTIHSVEPGADVTHRYVQTIHSVEPGADVTDSSVQAIHSIEPGADVTDNSVQTIHSIEPGADVTNISVQTINSFLSGVDVSNTCSSEQTIYSFQSDLPQRFDHNSNKPVLDVSRTRQTNGDILKISSIATARQTALVDADLASTSWIHHSRRALHNSLRPCGCNTSGQERHCYNKEKPFTSQFVFKKLFGPDFRVAKHYWHIEPPVLPPPCVKYKGKCDVFLNHIIGRGTFAEIAIATLHVDRQWRYVVLKEHYTDMVSKDHVFREAKMTMYLEPTGCVPVCYGLIQDGIGSHSVVLELVGTGSTLSDVLGKETLLKQHWLSIAWQLAEGLSKIHEMDILINDVKPDNVLVDLSSPVPVVKYCDFGCGSYRYGIVFTDPDMEQFVHLAPEVRAAGQTSKANDVYGLGRMLGQIVDVSGISAIVTPCQRCMDDNPDLRISAGEASAWLNAVHKEVEDTSDPYVSSGYGSASSSSYTSQSEHPTGRNCSNPSDTRHQINVSSLNILILLILMIVMALHPWVIGPCCYYKCCI
ncbi:uncharacterized protein LOC124266837 [Haliotis rubra]|uniref:uncharacterized protein LOC124266837 n=1 Tax=Haliotis rubra TaxID=36100 RepID=UPI001EE60E0D|nr:uncharacterized protein LOC124266837 [Haliotis rubra]